MKWILKEQMEGGLQKEETVVSVHSGSGVLIVPQLEVVDLVAMLITWATQTNSAYQGGENAWVYSPCFDLSSLSRPMISLDYWSDVRISDGTVIEYQRSDSAWVPLGRVDRGIKWYNAPFVPATPGDQNPALLTSIGLNAPIGWSGVTPNWTNARYKLDDIEVDSGSFVRLRIAFASNVNPLSRPHDGFSFDNVIIRNRTRNVLLETLSNIGYPNTVSYTHLTLPTTPYV